jgi:hypothetical protein
MKIGTLKDIYARMKEADHSGYTLARLIKESEFGEKDASVILDGCGLMGDSMGGLFKNTSSPINFIFGSGMGAISHIFRHHGRISFSPGLTDSWINFEKKDLPERMGVWGELLTPELGSTEYYRVDPAKVEILSNGEHFNNADDVYAYLVQAGRVPNCLSWEDGGDLLEQEEASVWAKGKKVFLWRSAVICRVGMGNILETILTVPVLEYPKRISSYNFKVTRTNRDTGKVEKEKHLPLTEKFITVLHE